MGRDGRFMRARWLFELLIIRTAARSGILVFFYFSQRFIARGFAGGVSESWSIRELFYSPSPALLVSPCFIKLANKFPGDLEKLARYRVENFETRLK